MSTTLPNTKRKFAIAYIESFEPVAIKTDLHRILNDSNDYEWAYSIRENFDSLLDLKIGERLQMQFNRDNENSTGFIQRIA